MSSTLPDIYRQRGIRLLYAGYQCHLLLNFFLPLSTLFKINFTKRKKYQALTFFNNDTINVKLMMTFATGTGTENRTARAAHATKRSRNNRRCLVSLDLSSQQIECYIVYYDLARSLEKGRGFFSRPLFV